MKSYKKQGFLQNQAIKAASPGNNIRRPSSAFERYDDSVNDEEEAQYMKNQS